MSEAERVKELLRAAGDGVVPSESDPVGAVARRSRRRSRTVALRSGAVVLVALAAVGIVLAGRLPSTSGPKPSATSSSAGTTPSTTAPAVTSTSAPATTLPPTTLAPAPTSQVLYQPFSGSEVDPRLHVTGHQTGPCSRYGGGVAPRFYYRCIGQGIFDPCFAGPKGRSTPFVCPSDPLTDDVTLFDATSVDTGSPPWTSMRPWAVELDTGQVCVFVSAAWGGLGPYDCEVFAGRHPIADCRAPNESTPRWTTLCQAAKTDASPFVPVPVRTAWT